VIFMPPFIKRLEAVLKVNGIKVHPVIYLFVGTVFPLSIGMFLVPLVGIFGLLTTVLLIDIFFGLPFCYNLAFRFFIRLIKIIWRFYLFAFH